MSPQFKLGFISGYILGHYGAREILEIKCISDHKDAKAGITDAVLNYCQKDETVNLFEDYSNIRFGQLLEGTDEFYKDFRNKNIPIGSALHYVKDQLKGVDAKELEKELNGWRKAAN